MNNNINEATNKVSKRYERRCKIILTEASSVIRSFELLQDEAKVQNQLRYSSSSAFCPSRKAKLWRNCVWERGNKDANVARRFKVNESRWRWKKRGKGAASWFVASHGVHHFETFPSSLRFSIYPTNCVMARRDLPKVCYSANLVCHVKWTVTFTVERARGVVVSLLARCCVVAALALDPARCSREFSSPPRNRAGISMTSANTR